MNIFGIPIFITYDYWVNFINTNFSTLFLTDDTIFITWLFVNFMYIYCVVLFVKFCKFVIMSFWNYVKKKIKGVD